MPIEFSKHAKEQLRRRKISQKQAVNVVMKMQYDKKVDAVYIELAKGKYSKTRKISDSVVVDEDNSGKVLGIEILDATKNISAFLSKTYSIQVS